MKIDVRHGSKNEVFCCSVKKVKEFFKDTNIYLNFSYLGKYFKTYLKESHYNYVKKNIKGIILCDIRMYPREESPILSFYLMNKQDFTEEMKEEFELQYLPLFYDLYIKQLNDQSLILKKVFMCVELVEGKLKLHSTII